MRYPEPRVPAFLQNVRSQPHLANLHREALACCRPGGLHLEFGVGAGTSLRMLREIIAPNLSIYGFDSFKGLPEAWNGYPRGAFAGGGGWRLPNVVLIEGWFADSVPVFAAQHADSFISYMHMDADLYASTRTVLSGLDALIVPGTVIIFDQLFGYIGWENHEYRALTEWGRAFEYVVRDEHWRAAVIIKQ